MLMSKLAQQSCIQSNGDADTDIASTALKLAESGDEVSVAVAADDTDILVMLVYHLLPDMADIFLYPMQKREINVRQLQDHLGHQTCKQILVVYACSGRLRQCFRFI